MKRRKGDALTLTGTLFLFASALMYSLLTLFIKLESIFRLQGYQWKTSGLRTDRSINEAKVGATQFCASLRGRAVPQKTIHLQGM